MYRNEEELSQFKTTHLPLIIIGFDQEESAWSSVETTTTEMGVNFIVYSDINDDIFVINHIIDVTKQLLMEDEKRGAQAHYTLLSEVTGPIIREDQGWRARMAVFDIAFSEARR